MSVEIRGKRDKITGRFAKAMERYVQDHPRAKVTLYRSGPALVRIRVVDPGFKGMDRVERDELVWPYLEKLPADLLGELYILLLLHPQELKKSIANMDFEDPVSSTF